jgi:hypothetical protein
VAIRTTDAAVRLIIKARVSIDTAPFIEVASNLVDRTCVSSGYDTATLELIERWLSAHFYAIRDMRRATQQVGSVLESFQHKVDLNLAVTVYGQQAMIIDSEGNLAALNRRTVDGSGPQSITHLGTTDADGNDITGD